MTAENGSGGRLRAGVVGVGTMGRHHARVYSELPGSRLVGVHDADAGRAETVAAEYGARAMSFEELLDAVDVVSVAVPTPFHPGTARDCLDAGVHTLVEKPFVDDPEDGRALADRAHEAGLVLQVGHVERFNPAVRVLLDLVPDLDVVGLDIERVGPPLDRVNGDNVVKDLMVHDLDILLSVVDDDIAALSAAAHDERHVAAQFRFDGGVVASLTASRLTQQKVRRLSVTATSCRVNVDFIDQTVEIHRRSFPEYVETNGDIRYRHESVVERPTVENGEPLKAELASFLTAVREGRDPEVTAEDGIRVVELAGRIERLAFGEREVPSP